MSPTKHAVLSPSHAHTWAMCPASAWHEKDVPNPSSPYAAEGTQAHALAENALNARFKNPDEPDNEVYVVGLELDEPPQEMLDNVRMYTDFVAERIAEARKIDPAAFFAFEHPVDVSTVTSEEGAKGIIDCAIAYPGHLWILDLKYGAGVPVEAEGNPQLCIYAAALMDEVEAIYDNVEEIHVAIVQPRCGGIRTWSLSRNALIRFKGNVRARGERAIRIYNGDKKAESSDYGCKEDVCRWCRGKATCPALAEQAAAACLADYKETEPVPEPVQTIRVPTDPALLAKAYSFLPALDTWAKMVRESVTARLAQGESVPGYKLVAGRKGPRKWTDADAVEKLMKSMRMKREDMYEMKLISPTKFEAAVKANPKLLGSIQQQKLRECITASEGKPAVVEESDKRPAITAANVSDFEATA